MTIIYEDDQFSILKTEEDAFQVFNKDKTLICTTFSCTGAIQFVFSHYTLKTFDVDKLPYGGDYNPPERIVCAANKYLNHTGEEVIIAGVRHACDVMYSSFVGHNSGENILRKGSEIQGFLTSKYRFVDRHEAWKIALEQNQIVRRCGGDTRNGGTLYSENLY